MLWKKEWKKRDMYTDCFRKLNIKMADLDELYYRDRPPQKTNFISNQLRNEGNVEFQAKHWQNAILAYNYALCFAEYDSEVLAQAYANRSACFFEIDQFNNSYNDIKLAGQISECSPELKSDIKKHHTDCLDFIGDNRADERAEHMTELDFDSNKAFPALAKVLQIDRRSTKNPEDLEYCITANCDIDVGRTICVEKSLISTLLSGQQRRCNVCFAKCGNLIPCENCTSAMFCSERCQDSILHAGECNINPSINVEGKLQFLIRLVLYAISLFNNIDDLMEFVERCNSCKVCDIMSIMTYKHTKYQHFLKLKSDRGIKLANKPDPLMYFAYKSIMNCEAGRLFISEKQTRFLTHLIWQHNAIISLGHVHEYTNQQQEPESLNLFLMFSHFNHSCTPNAMYYLIDDKLAVVTLTPIKKGDEICVSYFGKPSMLPYIPDKARKNKLKSLHRNFGKECECDFCSRKQPDRRREMQNDASFTYLDDCFNYKNVDGSWKLEQSGNVPLNIPEIKKNAMDFLRKYGRCVWCKELSKVAACFMDIIWLQTYREDLALVGASKDTYQFW